MSDCDFFSEQICLNLSPINHSTDSTRTRPNSSNSIKSNQIKSESNRIESNPVGPTQLIRRTPPIPFHPIDQFNYQRGSYCQLNSTQLNQHRWCVNQIQPVSAIQFNPIQFTRLDSIQLDSIRCARVIRVEVCPVLSCLNLKSDSCDQSNPSNCNKRRLTHPSSPILVGFNLRLDTHSISLAREIPSLLLSIWSRSEGRGDEIDGRS